ncbi:unnamed protein product [Clavelina lepadiformis]|uniref:Cyclin A n=1 Tax=Clavelina lepadiformis TaxID=159417 RepID=A0ABP0GJP1_CLALP
MITERQPLGALDTNSKRVQPSRAAKTGHKWLSQRHLSQNKENCMAFCNGRCNSFPQFPSSGKSSMDVADYNENNDSCYYSQTSVTSDISCKSFIQASAKDKCDNYIKQTICPSNQQERVPLKTLSLNVAPSISTTPPDKPKFFLPITHSDDITIASSMDTESDSSFRSATEDDFPDSFLMRSRSSKKSEKRRQSDDNYLRTVKRSDPDLIVLEEYLADILQHMTVNELRFKPNAHYLCKQPEITSSMRVKLVDWLVEVQDEYKLQNETLHLAVAYVDRFLSEMSVSRAKLQLLGTTCMFLAAKYEEIYPPDADEFAYVTADTYTRAEVLMMERLILNVFECALSVPTIHQYLTLFHEKSNVTEKCRQLSFYLADLMLLDEKYLSYTASVKAAASLSLAVTTLRHAHLYDVANGNLSVSSGKSTKSSQQNNDERKINANPPRVAIFSEISSFMSAHFDKVFQCAVDLAQSHVDESQATHFVSEKYSSEIHGDAAKVVPVLATLSVTQQSPMAWNNVMRLWVT